jgi:hypothetical protein
LRPKSSKMSQPSMVELVGVSFTGAIRRQS